MSLCGYLKILRSSIFCCEDFKVKDYQMSPFLLKVASFYNKSSKKSHKYQVVIMRPVALELLSESLGFNGTHCILIHILRC